MAVLVRCCRFDDGGRLSGFAQWQQQRDPQTAQLVAKLRAQTWERAQARERDATLQARRDARAQQKGQLAASAGPHRPDTPEQQQGVIAPAGRYGPMAAAAAGTSLWEQLD